MDWHRQVDIYCERLGPGFWAEPLNAVTNLAFVLAGLWAMVLARRAGRLDGPVIFLSGDLILIGIGSFLFHTVATRWAGLADVIPIAVFILGYFAVVANRFVGLGWGAAALATAGFLAALVGLATGLRLLDGALAGLMGLDTLLAGARGYLPALIGLWAVGAWLSRFRSHPAGREMVLAAGVFAASLAFRTLDEPVCSAFAQGTHFMWHILNATVLFLLIRAVIRHGRRPARA